MDVGGGESSSGGNTQQGFIPYCGCRKPMRLYVSNTDENPRRRYWKCVNWTSRESCRLFLWDDEITPTEAGVVPAAAEAKPCTACHYAEILLEAGTKKIEKLKLKLTQERSKVFCLGFGLVFSWIFFLGYECMNKRM